MTIKYKDKPINALVLDFDGTLYSNEGIEEKIWTDARKKSIQKLIDTSSRVEIKNMNPENLLEMYIKLGNEIGWENTFVKLGGNAIDFHQVADKVTKAEFLKYDEELTNFIREMREIVPVKIFTGSTRETVIDALKVLVGDLWLPLSENLLATDDMKTASKPNKVAYEEMLSVFGFEPSKTIFVDDQEVDVDVAASLDLITFLIQGSKTNDGEVKNSGADNPHVMISSVVELRNHLSLI
ncbi:HAD family hydrolase [Candidatus Woesebacteria bacterium]|nr:HAD family hydrolase [Candidatus Woesebacteria bacterium]